MKLNEKEALRYLGFRGKPADADTDEMIPEIALTYQTLLRFYQRFGDRVSVMNSTLSPGEKYLTIQ